MFKRFLFGSIYRIYEWRLEREVKKGPIPHHVAIIMDGNRRYARKLGRPGYIGHWIGSKTAEKVLLWCLGLKIHTLTVYALSTENLNRNEKEKAYLFKLIEEKLNELMEDKTIHRNKVRVKIIGDLSRLTPGIRALANELERITGKYSEYMLNIAIGYGGRQEILHAVKKIAEEFSEGRVKKSDITPEIVERYLYTDSPYYSRVDLLIRTGGEQRLSNFLPWQTNGGESIVYFCDIYWPEFRKIDLLRAIREYQKHITGERGRFLSMNVDGWTDVIG